MNRHLASRQKPVPKLVSMPRFGPGFPVIPSFTEGVNFTEVIGTTVSQKSCVCSTREGGRIVELGRAVWDAATGDKKEYAIKIGMVSRIRCHDSQRVGSDVLHALFHLMST